MILNDFCKEMGFDEATAAILSPVWQEMTETQPEDPEFLNADFIRAWLPRTGNDTALLPELEDVAAETARTPLLKLYAWILHHGLVRDGEMMPGMNRMPPPDKLLGDRAGMFVLMVALGALPFVEKKHQELGIPVNYTNDLFTWLKGTTGIHRAGHNGHPGLCINQYYWIRYYVEGKLFRIGRFEYLIHPLRDYVPAVFRSNRTGKLAVLSQDGWCYDENGQRAPKGIRTELRFADGCYVGTPTTPDARACLGKTVKLDAKEFQPVATPWEWVPSMHIPGGGGMTPEKAIASLKEAKVFFKKYFGRDIRLFVCSSWILNPDWETEMPDSNLAKFMRLGWCTTGGGPSRNAGNFFVFGKGEVDYDQVPDSNSLYRAFKRLHARGRELRAGGIIFPTDDLDQLSDGYYRNPERYVC